MIPKIEVYRAIAQATAIAIVAVAIGLGVGWAAHEVLSGAGWLP